MVNAVAALIAERTSRAVQLRRFVPPILGHGSMPERLVLASLGSYLAVFGLLLSFGRPGLGIGQGFYLPIALVALATGATWGAAAGVGAILLYEAGLLIPGHSTWSAVVAAPTGIRLASYVVAGATVGYFSRRGRAMLAASLHVLDDLLDLAKRDHLTAAFTGRGFESAINRRLATAAPFALLVGELSEQQKQALSRGRPGHDDRIREIGRLIARHLDQADEFARVGETSFAVLTSAGTPARARNDGVSLENALHAAGRELSFGWAFHPADGADVLALYGTAIERLHARQVVRGDWRPTATTAGLVEQLGAFQRAGR
jgi:GGDEF domain-containing protein